MKYVSSEYKASMQKHTRNKSYMRLSMGLINQEAQQNAEIENHDFTPYSDLTAPLMDEPVSKYYASYEENWSTVDGSMYFLPRSGNNYFQQGIVTQDLLSGAPEVKIIFNTSDPIDLKGITIKFGRSYPTKLKITTDEKEIIFENEGREFVTEETFDNTTFIIIKPLEMSKGNTRLRIEGIQFGIGLEFDDYKIISAKLKSSISPIAENLPTIDFSVKIENMDRYYNVDNPDSAINYVETGQEIRVYWGYGLDDGRIEWFKGATLYMQEWSADDTTANFVAVDRLEYMDDEYNKGQYYPEGITLYDLAELVFEDAGMEADEYWIDPYLKNITVYNPLPAVSHKQCLQLIANAGRSVLMQNVDGILMIKSSFVPDVAVSGTDETDYSDASTLLTNEEGREYASYENDFTKVNESQYFIPRDSSMRIRAGYVSNAISGEDGFFLENPTITFSMESAYTFHNIILYFGAVQPKEFEMRTYNNGVKVGTLKSKRISAKTIVSYDFVDVDTIVIEFTKAEPFNRIHVQRVEFGEATDYELTYDAMLKAPMGTRLEKVKEMRVTRTIYTRGTELKDITQEEIETPSVATDYEFTFSNAVHDLSVICMQDGEEVDVDVEMVQQTTYWCKVRIKNPPAVPMKVQLTIRGYEYGISTAMKSVKLNNSGKIQTWDNPLISSEQDAQNLVEWVGNYYASGNQYEITFRGDPSLDCNDLVYLENLYVENMMIRLEEIETTYEGAISGKITARRYM